jgi:hypothetical protein
MATMKTTNQEFPIPDEWVVLADESQEAKNQRDTRIRRKLGSYIPALTNGQITYTQEGEEMVVRVTPQLGTKAVMLREQEQLPSFFFLSRMQCDLEDVHARLRDALAYLPPTLSLAWELKWLQVTGQLTFQRLIDYQPKIRETITANHDARLVEHIHERLRDLPAISAPAAPLGF